MLVSAGEALIDLLPVETTDGRQIYEAKPGGSPFNVAIALGRLGVPAAFLSSISRDAFGDALVDTLRESRVSLSLVARVSRPTPLAIVSLDRGQPQYSFHDLGTAARGMNLAELPPVPPAVEVLHFGSLALLSDPAASTILAKVKAAATDRLVSFDPNIRTQAPMMERIYRRNIEAALGIAHVVKLSDEDLAWLRPGMSAHAFAAERLKAGAALVIVTRGAEGATGFHRAGQVPVDRVDTEVVDTVGAGDAFSAALLAALYRGGLSTVQACRTTDTNRIRGALEFAARHAAATCTRVGADPPFGDVPLI